jgi:ABC-type phosphate transport system substrate-binding protein
VTARGALGRSALRRGAFGRRSGRSCALVALLAFVLLLCSFAVSVGRPVAAATVRTAEVAPATGLTDQVALVTWQGFDPTKPDGTFGVVIMECSAAPQSVLADCNTAGTFPLSLTGNQQPGVTNANGTGRAFMDIMTTARLPQLACSETKPCSLLLYENTPAGFDPNHLPPVRTIVPLQFRKSAGDCPPVTHFDARIETETSAARALYQWAADLCNGKNALTLNVTNTSSDQARADFFAKNVDIAVSSLPPQPGETPAGARQYTVAPIDLTGVVVAYNIMDPVTHQPISDLTLTPRLVARLISDSDVLTFFNDPEFKKLNPGHTFPPQGTDPGLRGEQNADTWIVTNWLNSDPVARAFLNGKDPYGIPVNPLWQGVQYPTNVFEARSQNGVYFPRIGEDGVAERVFAQTKPADTVPSSPIENGFFGVLDLPTARQYDLPIARLTTGVGKPVVSVSRTSLAAGFAAMTSTPNGFHVEPGAPADPNAWPLTKVDHAMLPTTLANTAQGVQVQALLGYAVGAGQQTVPNGYAPLPTALAAQTLRAAAALTVGTPAKSAGPPAPTTTSTIAATRGSSGSVSGASGFVPLLTGTGFSGSGAPTASLPSAPATGPPEQTVRVKEAVKSARKTNPVARFAGLLLAGAGDHLVLPIVFVLALLALLASTVDGFRRRWKRWLASVRGRLRRSGARPQEQPAS